MRPLTVQDVAPADEYERIRSDFRQRVIAFKKHRRISVGDFVTLVFENRETILFQIQEMVRAERILAPERLQEEVDTYNEQIPGAGELSATFFIEVTDSTKVKPFLDLFQGIDRGQAVAIRVGSHVVDGVFEQGRSKDDKISAVQYVRFTVPDTVRVAMQDYGIPMELLVDHPRYQARATVPDAMRASLLEDLEVA